MKTIVLAESVENAVLESARALSAGGVILYPTDTLYGLGADAFSDAAVAKVQSIKGRDEKKPISAIFADMAMVEEYAEVNETARKLAEKFLPGPLTMVLKKKPGVNTGIARDLDTIGVRIPNHPFCLALAREFGKPYTTTSANAAGMPPLKSVGMILEQLGASASLVLLVVEGGEAAKNEPSTVLRVENETIHLLRPGAILEIQDYVEHYKVDTGLYA